jgi:16S rRNA (cytidine1402-2'-O)-methyltransferase
VDIEANAVPQTMEAGLYVVATPIGNLRDITLRALDVLMAADLILCEDTRITRRLAARYGLKATLTAYHEHNAHVVGPEAVARIQAGGRVALVSDAGTPLISDPGGRLVADVVAAGLPVIPIPGPSAPLAALVASGLPAARFLFAGFLPDKTTARRKELQDLTGVPATLVFFESPKRLGAALADMAAVLGPRPAAVCRELTKTFEEVRRGSLADLAESYDGAEVKGEIVIVVAPPLPKTEAERVADLDDLLADALGRGSLADAVREVVSATGLPRRQVYDRALTLADKRRS